MCKESKTDLAYAPATYSFINEQRRMNLVFLPQGQGNLCAFSRTCAYLKNVASHCGTHVVTIAYQQSVAIMLPYELCRSLLCSIAALGMLNQSIGQIPFIGLICMLHETMF